MYRYSILFQEIHETGFPDGWYYAHIPALNLTTHGHGLEGAREAAADLLRLWLEEKRVHGETVPKESTVFYSQIEIPDAVQSLEVLNKRKKAGFIETRSSGYNKVLRL